MRRLTRSSTLLSVACVALMYAGHAAAAANETAYGYETPQDTGLQVDADGAGLQAGEFAWLPAADASSDNPVTLLVSLRDQRAFLYRDGRRIAVTTVSTGKPGHDTPYGVFPITEKKKTHFSNKYDDAPMPWMQRLTRWGHALHAGKVRAFPASHGCIRLPAEFARQLFSLTRTGDLVVVSQDTSVRSVAIALAAAGADSQVALQVGVTEPLPPIVFVKRDEMAKRASSGQVGAESLSAN